MADYLSDEDLKNNLDKLREYKQEEFEIVSEAESKRAELEAQFAALTRKVKEDSQAAELNAQKSAASSMAKFLGLGIKEQALVMIPFEIAEATKEMGNFLATKDPSHLAASLKHALAVKQYADAAKASAHQADSGGSAGSLAGQPQAPSAPAPAPKSSTVVVNVGDGVVVDPKEFARQLIAGLNEAYHDNVNIEFAG
jgi:hypothetical protein